MSTAGQLWFDQGYDAFKRSFPHIAAQVPADRFYVCPLCLIAFHEDALRLKALTREHVPPKSLGGKRLAVTCGRCNSNAGHKADSHARRESDVIGFMAGDLKEIKAHLRTESGRVPIRLSARGGGVQMFGVPRAASQADQDAVQGDFTGATGDGNWEDFRFKVDFPPFSPDRAAASWLRSAYLAFFAALGYRRQEPAAPTLMRVEGPEAFRSFAMFYDRHAVFLPRYHDAAFFARLAQQPAGMVTFTGKQYPWPVGGPTFFHDQPLA